MLNSIHLSFSCMDQAAACWISKYVVIMKLVLNCLSFFAPSFSQVVFLCDWQFPALLLELAQMKTLQESHR